ncbi:MAG: glycosyltransferase family 4 protein [Gammaproteobacteria bacterium]
MRILVHDYTGHAFQADLSRHLAALGHEVLHLSCASFPAPKGALERTEADPESLCFETLTMPGGGLSKYRYVHRWRQERAYGRLLTAKVRAWRPDVLLICNTPLDPLERVARFCRGTKLPMVFWIQDVYSQAISRYLGERFGPLGRLVGALYERKEARVARQARSVVAISEHFRPVLERWKVPEGSVQVIPNWAPLSQFPLESRDNSWSRRHGLANKRVLIYAGTLGLKHDPDALLTLARALRSEPDVRVLLVSSGPHVRRLESEAAREGLDNFMVMPFQPVEEVAHMQASATILLSVLEAGAGTFSVPSKVLSQLCAERPLLAAMPRENDAARMITDAGAGVVVEPGNVEGWVAAAHGLLSNPGRAREMGRAARRVAEQRFQSQEIAKRFESILRQSMRSGA